MKVSNYLTSFNQLSLKTRKWKNFNFAEQKGSDRKPSVFVLTKGFLCLLLVDFPFLLPSQLPYSDAPFKNFCFTTMGHKKELSV